MQAAAEPDQAAVAADHAVAGDENRQRIAVVGTADGPAGAGIAGHFGQLFVTPGLSVGNLLQAFPYFQLKIGSVRLQRQFEKTPFSGKILFQLPGGAI